MVRLVGSPLDIRRKRVMPNPVLERLVSQRAEQMSAMDSVLNQVGEERDLVDAERSLLDASRERIAELDAQIQPLRQYEEMREAHSETVATLPRPAEHGARRMEAMERTQYRSAGAFVVDYLRANALMDRNMRDDAAAARIYNARADQLTGDTPGLLPTPIVGAVVNLIDTNRPLIQSLGGARGLGGIAGTSFTRPKITQHTTIGAQATQKTALSSQKMTVGAV